MGGLARTVLRSGDWVRFDGGEHQVVAPAGTLVRLRSTTGGEQVVLAGYLLATPEFAGRRGTGTVGGAVRAAGQPARGGPRAGAGLGTARGGGGDRTTTGRRAGLAIASGVRPARTTLNERDAAKAAEVGVSVRTIQSRRARFAQQGLWGLVDQRAVRTWLATGRADARLGTAIREALDAETHTVTGTHRGWYGG
jgi:hypothetical protein